MSKSHIFIYFFKNTWTGASFVALSKPQNHNIIGSEIWSRQACFRNKRLSFQSCQNTAWLSTWTKRLPSKHVHLSVTLTFQAWWLFIIWCIWIFVVIMLTGRVWLKAKSKAKRTFAKGACNNMMSHLKPGPHWRGWRCNTTRLSTLYLTTLSWSVLTWCFTIELKIV